MAQKPISFEKVAASVGRSGAGLYRSRLTPKHLADLKKFGTYLDKVERLSPNTVRAYQSWVAKAGVDGVAVGTHVKSAMRAYGRYLKSK